MHRVLLIAGTLVTCPARHGYRVVHILLELLDAHPCDFLEAWMVLQVAQHADGNLVEVGEEVWVLGGPVQPVTPIDVRGVEPLGLHQVAGTVHRVARVPDCVAPPTTHAAARVDVVAQRPIAAVAGALARPVANRDVVDDRVE